MLKSDSSGKILLVTVRADVGGGPKHVYELARHLKTRSGAKVYIASPTEEPFGVLFKESAEKFLEMPSRSFTIPALYQLWSFCRRNGIKTIHSHGRGAGIYTRLMKFFGYRVIHTYHGIHQEPSLKGKVKLLIDRLLEPLTDISIFVSESELKTAKKAGLGNKSKAIVINNGIELNLASRHKIDTHKIGTLARLTYQKGLDTLIKYFRHFRTTYPELKLQLLIAGGGEDEKSLKNLASSLNLSDQVVFMGEIRNPQEFLGELSIYVSTARWEGLPLSVLEAMNSGVPCLLSPAPGHENFIESGAALPCGSREEFAENLARLCKDDSASNQLVTSASNYLKKEHNIYDQIDLTFNTYGF